MKIYTKTGDKGTTSLYGGKRIAKSSALITTVGEIDELNALIGFALSLLDDTKEIDPVRNSLIELQSKLFVLGADLATPLDANQKLHIVRINEADVKKLETEIDAFDTTLAPLKNFILPGGSPATSLIYLMRAVCRRAERSATLAALDNQLNEQALIFLNRLSDWLFMLSRYTNSVLKIGEQSWIAN